MGKKNRPTFIGILWKIIIEPVWYWLITIIPAVIAFVEFVGGDNRIITVVPPYVWLVIAGFAFVLTVSISAYKYVKDYDVIGDGVSIDVRSIKQSGGQTANTIINLGEPQALVQKKMPIKIDTDKLRLADGMIPDGTWREFKEHSLTLINETGHDIKQCYVMLDEVAWNNFEKKWGIVARDVFDRPFKWNRDNVTGGKIDIDNGDRASFAFILHKEYSVYNSTEKRNQVRTDFYFVFSGDEYVEIGYGADIRLRISIRGKDQNGKSFESIFYYLYVHLLQPHGIPKVEVVKIERIKKRAAEPRVNRTRLRLW